MAGEEVRAKGRVALVAGAARGIGQAVVARLVSDGFRVAALDVDEARMERLIPFHRVAQPEEQATALSFLVSDDASCITGQVISVSGGLTMVD